MKTKKTVIAVLMAALVTALIIGCIAPLDNTTPEAQSAPEGKTLVSLSLGNSDPRAVIKPDPATTYPTLASIPYFLLKVYNDTDSAAVSLTGTAFSTYCTSFAFSTTNTIALDSGKNYTFLVLACTTNDNGTTKYVAWGTRQINNLSSDQSVGITLKEIAGDAPSTFNGASINSNGEFSWNFGTSDFSTYDTATLTLYTLAGVPVTSISNIDLMSSNTGTESIASGFYRVIIKLEKANHENGYVQEIVYIYSGFTSTCNLAALPILPTLRQNVYTLLYNYGSDEPSGGRSTSESLGHGKVILSEISNTAPSYSSTGYHFAGWYYDTAATASKVGNTDKIIKGLTLYAAWDIDSFVNVNLGGVSLSWSSGPSYGTPTFTSVSSISYNDTTLILTLNLAVTGLAGVASETWKIDNIPVNHDDIITLATATDMDVFWQAGSHTVTLEVNDSSGSSPASYTFTYSYP
ncbi:MAG: hypothetical protein LBV17_00355 [Treponema sp.]|jgi:uncharacterized repeat protein (TIGR02543 family)|nr:hypothetical protein [Treponema sp.]